MPHEDLTRLQPKLLFRDRLAFNAKFFFNMLRITFSPYERKIDICQDFFNGKNVGTLHRKFDFIEQIRSLGYRGPEQVLFIPGQEHSLQQAISLIRSQSVVLCKPRDGQQGKGIFRCEGEAELRAKLGKLKEAYIVQEFVPPLIDYRYVYHVDSDVKYRFCYAKVRPEIRGDGENSLHALLRKDTTIPASSKQKILKSLSAAQLDAVPATGEKVALVHSGNISRGAYGIVVKGADLAALDKVMLPLIDDLQKHYKLQLTTYCFDLGVLRSDTTPENVTKSDYVFYEYQIPFGLSGYLGAEEIRKDKARVAKVFWMSLQRAWVSRRGRVSYPKNGRRP